MLTFDVNKKDKPRFGYKLFDLGNRWQLVSPTETFSGSFDQVKNYAVLTLGFEIRELELGKEEMEKHFHNAAEYGIFKRFMWTFDKETNTNLH